jgi:hypothetical protein
VIPYALEHHAVILAFRPSASGTIIWIRDPPLEWETIGN